MFVPRSAAPSHRLLAGDFSTNLTSPGNARVILDKATGRLFYDPDAGGAVAKIHFATVLSGPSPAADLSAFGRLVGTFRPCHSRIPVKMSGPGIRATEPRRGPPRWLEFRFLGIEIAQELVAGISSDSRTAVVGRSTIRLAHDLGIETIAEGVEHADQARFLLDAGCEYAQGYYYSRPMLADKVAQLLSRTRTRPLEKSHTRSTASVA